MNQTPCRGASRGKLYRNGTAGDAVYDQVMPYLSQHLSNLRREITTLRDMHARYSEKSEHSPLDQSALELRASRLAAIKQELAKILDRPGDPGVWWEKFRRPGRVA